MGRFSTSSVGLVGIYLLLVAAVYQLGLHTCTSPFLLWSQARYETVLAATFSSHSILHLVVDLISLTIVLKSVQESPVQPLQLFVALFVVYSLTLVLWPALGWLFLRGTGWAAPAIFFPSLFHSCSRGITPILFILLPWLHHIPSTNAFLLLCLWGLQIVNVMVHYALFWIALICYVVGFVTSFLVGPFFQFYGTASNSGAKKTDDTTLDVEADKNNLPSTDVSSLLLQFKITARRNLGPSFSLLVVAAVVLAVAFNFRYQASFQADVCWADSQKELAPDASASPWLVVAVPTMPRPDSQRYLVSTLESLLAQLPDETKSTHWLWSGVRVVVMNHAPGGHRVFAAAVGLYAQSVAAKHYLEFVDDPPLEELAMEMSLAAGEIGEALKAHPVRKMHWDMATTLWMARARFPEAKWVMIAEDDFELCPDGLNEMLAVICKTSQSDDCGAFIATGGSGLIIHRDHLDSVVGALVSMVRTGREEGSKWAASDQTIQLCLRGAYPRCNACQNRLTVSSRMVFRHIGHRSARTGMFYDNKYTCDWRQPFNGDPDVHVVLLPK